MKRTKMMMNTIGLLLLVFSTIGCGNQRQFASIELSDGYGKMSRADNLSSDGWVYSQTARKNEVDKSENKNDSKILYSASLTLTVKQIDNAVDSIKSIAKQYKGYVVETGTYKSVIRVESKYFNQAIEALVSLGKIDRKRIQGHDVTNEYLDLGIRLENAEKARLRYLELLNQAENVQAALLVEKELERLNGTIDMIKGKMNRIDHLAEYSTITIFLNEQVKPGILGYVGIGIYRSVKWLFVRN